jgi:phospholipase C
MDVRFLRPGRAVLAVAACAASLVGCAVRSSPLPATAPAADARSARTALGIHPQATGKITHVVWIMQENRSFDNLFQGYPGADTVSQGLDSHGNTIALQPISLSAPYDIDHSYYAHVYASDGGKNDGFNLEAIFGGSKGYPHPQYGYVPPAESQAYFNMASRYVVADRMFASQIDASFVSHQYMIAGQANSAVDLPLTDWGCDGGKSDTVGTLLKNRQIGPAEQPCFDYPTLADELDAAGLGWSYYAYSGDDIWSAYQAVSHIRYGQDWQNVHTPNSQALVDIRNGTLANVTWIVPDFPTSDHAGSGSALGPQWVSALVDAIGASKYWDSTAIFVMWDEWGGWYDHVKAPYVDYDGLGFRVPLLVISPYAKENYVSHVQYEHGSILRFIEDQFGLGQLAASDTRATSPEADCFDFTQAPRKFHPFKLKVSTSAFFSRPPGALGMEGQEQRLHFQGRD